jgi:hypothetical protein
VVTDKNSEEHKGIQGHQKITQAQLWPAVGGRGVCVHGGRPRWDQRHDVGGAGRQLQPMLQALSHVPAQNTEPEKAPFLQPLASP